MAKQMAKAKLQGKNPQQKPASTPSKKGPSPTPSTPSSARTRNLPAENMGQIDLPQLRPERVGLIQKHMVTEATWSMIQRGLRERNIDPNEPVERHSHVIAWKKTYDWDERYLAKVATNNKHPQTNPLGEYEDARGAKGDQGPPDGRGPDGKGPGGAGGSAGIAAH